MRSHVPASRPSAPASTTPQRVGNSHDRNGGTLTIVDTPINASWLNQIEACFSILQRKALTPTDSATLDALAARITAFEDHYRQIAQPFDWTFTRADLDRVLPRSPTTNPPAARGLTIRTSGRSTSCGASGGS